MDAIYRNLTRGGLTKRPAYVNRNGYASHLKGGKLSYPSSKLVMTNIITNNPTTIKKGCARILRTGIRDVCAFVAGNVRELSVPMGVALPSFCSLGHLSLNFEDGVFEVKCPDNTERVFFPEDCVLSFSPNGVCEVFVSVELWENKYRNEEVTTDQEGCR